MSEFTAFVQRPEKVEAFQFHGINEVEAVLDAFGVPHDRWTLARDGKKYRLSFDLPSRGKAASPGLIGTLPYLDSRGVLMYDNVNYVSPNYSVTSGSWVVKRYIDTDHPEVTVVEDKAFRQKYQASIEAG